jgi:CRP/FNR family transcriptional regulator, polysaccharide utilization system transcription regulator
MSDCRFCSKRMLPGVCELAGTEPLPATSPVLVTRYRPRDVIFREGDPALAVYCLSSGLVKLYKNGAHGEQIILRLIRPGSLVGHRSALIGELHDATAEALTESRFCVIRRESFLQMVKQSPALSLRILERTANDLRATEDATVSLAYDSVQKRVMQLLTTLLLASDDDMRKRNVARVPLSRTEMAQMVGTTLESMSRTLHQLQNKGVLELRPSEIRILKPTVLSGHPGYAEEFGSAALTAVC